MDIQKVYNKENSKSELVKKLHAVLMSKIYNGTITPDEYCELGVFYQFGFSSAVDQDLEKAIEYHKLAIDGGNKKSLYYLGIFYYMTSDGFYKHPEKGLAYLKRSMQSGNNDAKAIVLEYKFIKNINKLRETSHIAEEIATRRCI